MEHRKILLTGWTGNTGDIVLRMLLEMGISENNVVGISRNKPHKAYSTGVLCETLDLGDEESVGRLFQRYSFTHVIHTANIRYSPLILRLADETRVKQAILVHTTGIYSRYQQYSHLYQKIEQSILGGVYENTSYTIVRPTMIYGNSLDHNMHKLILFLERFRVYPLFGNGTSLLQPVHVEDLSKAIVSCIDNPMTYNRVFDLSGGSIVSYKRIISLIALGLNRKIVPLKLPVSFSIVILRILKSLFRNVPINIEQVKRLQEDKVYSHDSAMELLNFRPRSFEQGIMEEIRGMREEGLLKK